MPKQSLASKINAADPVDSNPGHDWLPATFQPEPNLPAVIGPSGALPYVSFVSTKGPAFARVAMFIPDLEDADPVLMWPEPKRPEKLSPFRFHLIKYFQHWSVVDSQGKIVKTTLDAAKAKKSREWAEHIETVLLVVTPSGLVCASCTFKTTKVNAAHRAIETLNQLADPESREAWFAQSAEHKVTQAAPVDWTRFTSVVKLKKGVGRYPYVAATSVPVPATAADWVAIGNYFKDEGNKASAEAVDERFARRVATIRAKIEG